MVQVHEGVGVGASQRLRLRNGFEVVAHRVGPRRRREILGPQHGGGYEQRACDRQLSSQGARAGAWAVRTGQTFPFPPAEPGLRCAILVWSLLTEHRVDFLTVAVDRDSVLNCNPVGAIWPSARSGKKGISSPAARYSAPQPGHAQNNRVYGGVHQNKRPQVAARSGEVEPRESQADGAGDDHTAAALGRMQGSEPGRLQDSRQNTAAFGVSSEGQQAQGLPEYRARAIDGHEPDFRYRLAPPLQQGKDRE